MTVSDFLSPQNVLLIAVLVGQVVSLLTSVRSSGQELCRRIDALEQWRREHETAHEEIYVRKDVVGAKLDSIEQRLVKLEEKLDEFASRKPRR